MRTNFRASAHQPSSHYQINDAINAQEMRLIDDQGRQLGIMGREEARAKAEQEELDLVLISAQAKPPVVKLIDYKKFLYQESKKQQEAKKGVKKSVIKDVKLSLFIGQGDLDRLIRRTDEFIKSGHQVRINILLKGREMGKRNMAFDLMKNFISAVGDVAVSTEPKMQGRIVLAVIGKKK